MTDRIIKVQNKSDKPSNVAERENRILEECEKLQQELPSFLRGYFMFLSSNDLPLTRLSYLRDLKFFFEYLIAHTELCERLNDIKNIKEEDLRTVDAVTVNMFLDYCRRYKISDGNSVTVIQNGNASLARKKSSLTAFFKYCYRDGIININFTDAIDPIRLSKPGDREIKALTEDEVMKMLDAAENGNGLSDKEKSVWQKTKQRDRLILLLFLTYGLRLSELQQLNLSSFNYERGEFKIYRKRAKESIMPLNKTIESALKNYITEERPSEGIRSGDEDALLLSLRLTRLSDRQIREIVKKYTAIPLGTSKADAYSPHKLRATAATSLIARGNSVYDVQELLDHDNVSTTQLYAKHREAAKREIIKSFEWDEDK